jgi:signal transduction histidine kinase
MKQMFASATLKMTAWYLLILTTISLIFSIVIYQISTHELDDRLSYIQTRIERRLPPMGTDTPFNELRESQSSQGKTTLFLALLYTNLVILGLGGIASYFLAKRTLRPIEESHEAEARFTSNASHELRTPLAVMKSELEVTLRDKSATKDEMREVLESNLEEVNRLTALSNTLLKLSRNQLSSKDFGKVNVSEILEKTLAAHPHENKTFETSLTKQVRIEQGNASSLMELFLILVDNACRYSPENSTINVSLHEQGNYAVFCIQNRGDGISATDLPRIFERFYRGDKSHTSGGTQQGYGLGLSLAKQIVSLHKGEITLESEPKKYTVATVRLPKSAKTLHFSENSQAN